MFLKTTKHEYINADKIDYIGVEYSNRTNEIRNTILFSEKENSDVSLLAHSPSQAHEVIDIDSAPLVRAYDIIFVTKASAEGKTYNIRETKYRVSTVQDIDVAYQAELSALDTIVSRLGCIAN